MMDEHKLMGKRDGEYVFPEHRVEYDGERSIERQVVVENDKEKSNYVRVRGTKILGPDNPQNDTNGRYVVLCENDDALTRVTEILDNRGNTYDTQSVSIASAERTDIKDYRPENESYVPDAIKWGNALRDVDNPNSSTKFSDFARGHNPEKGEDFEPPGRRGRSR